MKAGLSGVEQLGLKQGLVVQELGWDEDADAELREEIMDVIDADMIDEALESVDVVVLWWREEDGDLVDGLVDSMTDLADDGYIWLFTPKIGRPSYIDPAEIDESATTAGLSLTNSVLVSDDWQAHKVVRPKGARR